MDDFFKLIGAATFRSFRCLWMLEELNTSYPHVPARPQGKVTKANNPLGKVPALVESSLGDRQEYFTMYESAAITNYLGDLSTEVNSVNKNNLIPPPGTKLRGLYDQTVSCITCELDSQALWIQRKFGYSFINLSNIPVHVI